MNNGWIEIICGSMFSGKSEELIRRVKRVKLAKQKIKIFKPKEDVRFKKKKIVSHNENHLKSEVIEIAVINSKEDFHTLDTKTVSEALKKIK